MTEHCICPDDPTDFDGPRCPLHGPPRCRCIWHDVRCDQDATQEDGLCDWCGVRRADGEDMRDNPFAQWHPITGEYMGLAGGTVTGYNHQAGWGPIPDSVRPTACWIDHSERTLA